MRSRKRPHDPRLNFTLANFLTVQPAKGISTSYRIFVIPTEVEGPAFLALGGASRRL
jgi:hypothetical protein